MTRPTVSDLRSWPPTVPLHDPKGGPDVASALGIGRHVYELAARGELPVTPLRLGRRLMVPTAALLAALGIEEAPTQHDAPGCLAAPEASVSPSLSQDRT